MIELLRPWALLLLPLPMLARWLLPASPAGAVMPVPASVQALLFALSRSQDHRRTSWTADLWPGLIGWVALIVALAGPQSHAGTLLKPTGRDLIVAIDLSASMDQQDMLVNGKHVSRLAVVHEQVGTFLANRAGDRVGLIAFSQEAFLIAPLTFDTRGVVGFLDELTIGLPGHRTDLGRAIGLSIKTFKQEPLATRVLVLISDGENNTGRCRSTMLYVWRLNITSASTRSDFPPKLSRTARQSYVIWRQRPEGSTLWPTLRWPWRRLPTRSSTWSPRRSTVTKTQ